MSIQTFVNLSASEQQAFIFMLEDEADLTTYRMDKAFKEGRILQGERFELEFEQQCSTIREYKDISQWNK